MQGPSGAPGTKCMSSGPELFFSGALGQGRHAVGAPGPTPPGGSGQLCSASPGILGWESLQLEMEEQSPLLNPSQELRASPSLLQSSQPLRAMGLTAAFYRVSERRRDSPMGLRHEAELRPEQLSPGQEAGSD